MTLSKNLARAARRTLYAAYLVAALAVTWGIYRDGGLQTSSSSGSAAADVLIGLLLATMLAEPFGVFNRKAGWREALKFGLCAVAALIWVFLFGNTMPNTAAGATIALAPACALFLASMFYLARFAGTRIPSYSYFFRPSQPLKAVPTLTPGIPPGITASRTGSLEMDIPANRLAMLLRVGMSVGIAALLAFATYRSSFGHMTAIAMALSVVYLVGYFAWVLAAGNPLLSIGSDGLSIQRGLAGIRHLDWAEIISFELRTYAFNAFLVVHVRNADALMASQGPYTRWLMRQSVRNFGSPVRIPAGWLKCDRNWLLMRANQMLAEYGRTG